MSSVLMSFVQLFPTVTHVMGKFKGKLDRDDLKRFAKEVHFCSQTAKTKLS